MACPERLMRGVNQHPAKGAVPPAPDRAGSDDREPRDLSLHRNLQLKAREPKTPGCTLFAGHWSLVYPERTRRGASVRRILAPPNPRRLP